ncbi:DUF1993 family protein [Paracoccus sp. 11-3]|uniref:DUF1993 family protein n=1 Tax=Paracoccus amoyensis TaxID=2760093 RepID=A0A926GC88_9RHOB|nr:DUF1993 family protein [Paracoccus amoyensis]MBC9246450.1 DUF1993 family protein [Paracoccus amoyensis]
MALPAESFDPVPEAVPATVLHYLDQIGAILQKLVTRDDAADLLAIRLAPDMFDTALQFAIAIRFAARTMCPPTGQIAPDIPKQRDCHTLLGYKAQIADLIRPIRGTDMVFPVTHHAGQAVLTQEAVDYAIRFALPNMMFHTSMAYAGLRHGGMAIGKADFDGLHAY